MYCQSTQITHNYKKILHVKFFKSVLLLYLYYGGLNIKGEDGA